MPTVGPSYPLGKLREFVKDRSRSGRNSLTLRELHRWLDPGFAERIDLQYQAREAIGGAASSRGADEASEQGQPRPTRDAQSPEEKKLARLREDLVLLERWAIERS